MKKWRMSGSDPVLWLLVMMAGCAQQKPAQTAVVLEAVGSIPPAVASETPLLEPAAAPSAKALVRVEEAVFCTGIKDRVPEGVGESFDASVRKVFFFTRVLGAKKPTTVTHVWYWNERKMAEVPLDVRSENWRTWSSKNIEPSWKGSWAVKVLDESGDIVVTKNFEIR